MTPREEFERFERWLGDNGVSLCAVSYPFSDPRPIDDTRWLADAYEADHRDRAFDGSERAA